MRLGPAFELQAESAGAPEPALPSGQGVGARVNVGVTAGQVQVFRLVSVFLPNVTIIRNAGFQTILVSSFFQACGRSTLSYGATLAIVLGGGQPLESAMIGVASMLPAAFLGPLGGLVADSLARRTALAFSYGGMAALCFLLPTVFGTGFWTVWLVVFAVNCLGQIASPAMASIAPLVAEPEELAAGNSLLTVAGALGSGLGLGFLAPVLAYFWGITPVLYLAGAMLAIASTRILAIPILQRMHRVDWTATVKAGGWGSAIDWLVHHWEITTIVLIGAGANSMGNIVSQMSPQFVEDVLHLNPALAMYVVAPGAAGGGIAVVAAVPLQRRFGERNCAVAGFVIGIICVFLMAMVVRLTPAINVTNPLWYAEKLTGWAMSPSVLALAWVSFPAGFAGALTGLSTQTYINRRLPFRIQGRTFALQNSITNLIAIIPLIILGQIGNMWGMQVAMFLIPFMLIGFVMALVSLGFKLAKEAEPPDRGEVLRSFWQGPAEEVDYSNMPGPTPHAPQPT